MILVVKERTYKTYLRKSVMYVLLVAMFGIYYNHMSSKFQEMNNKLETELAEKTSIIKNKVNITQKVEKIIYKEAEKCVELLGQEKVKSVKIENNRLIIVCDYNTEVEALFIRYGIMALVKSTPEDIRISVDIKFIVESNYEV
ncbi:MAG TPA: hypothetical protein ENK66_11035 [Arcobacter sp.]|jgi:hypothetical protein|nr:hypothetical protein [Arcobacter sp.]